MNEKLKTICLKWVRRPAKNGFYSGISDTDGKGTPAKGECGGTSRHSSTWQRDPVHLGGVS